MWKERHNVNTYVLYSFALYCVLHIHIWKEGDGGRATANPGIIIWMSSYWNTAVCYICGWIYKQHLSCGVAAFKRNTKYQVYEEWSGCYGRIFMELVREWFLRGKENVCSLIRQRQCYLLYNERIYFDISGLYFCSYLSS